MINLNFRKFHIGRDELKIHEGLQHHLQGCKQAELQEASSKIKIPNLLWEGF